MLKNYFTIAIAVLKRRKFFTFISLFGISFTLTVLLVATSFVDNMVGANYPETERDRTLYILTLQQKSSKLGYSNNGPFSFSFFQKYIATLKTPEKIAMSSMFFPTNTYINNKKLVLDMNFTNDAFWDVMQFQFVEGKPYTKQQIENGEKLAVITENTKQDYFGDASSVVGRFIEADNVRYKVTGVVKNVPVTRLVSYGDVYVPYTSIKRDLKSQEYQGNFLAVLLLSSASDKEKAQQEYASVVSKIPPQNKDLDLIISNADSFLSTVISNTPLSGGKEGGLWKLYAILGAFALLFMLLPALNLVNINSSRIMERSSEIGVRKAFGASSGTLVGQFLVENLILTFIGTLIGLALTFAALQYINSSGVIPHLQLGINFTVLVYAIIACVVFGLISGVLPAWRMSRMQVVTALKS